jgi:hypothetical protein
MMKAGIFETEHFEAAYPLLRLFEKENNRITVFSYPSSYHQLAGMLNDEMHNYDWVKRKEKQSKISFIYTIYRETKKRKISLLYLNTVSDNFIFYALLVFLLPKVRVILTIHTINAFFETKNSFSLRGMVRALGKKILRSVVREYNVLSQTMISHLEQKLPPGKKIHCIPGGIFENSSGQRNDSLHSPVSIVIPGLVDSKRRNYEQAFELLSLLQQQDIPVLMTFLGGFYGEYGQQVAIQCREWNHKNKNLRYYETGTIVQAEFDQILNEADFIFTPSVINTVIDDKVEEVYGLSMSSGNVSDVIRHAKPFIIPSGLAVDKWLEKSCIRYSTISDIVSFLKSVSEDPALYTDLSRFALEASKQYTIQQVRNRNKDVFGE